jgi:hypothetical protein
VTKGKPPSAFREQTVDTYFMVEPIILNNKDRPSSAFVQRTEKSTFNAEGERRRVLVMQWDGMSSTPSLLFFSIDISDRFEKIKETINLPKYPHDSFTLLRSNTRSSCRRVPRPVAPPPRRLLTPWCRPSCLLLLPKPRHQRSWWRRLPLTERAQPSRSTIPLQGSTSLITYNRPPVTRFVSSSSALSSVHVMICM